MLNAQDQALLKDVLQQVSDHVVLIDEYADYPESQGNKLNQEEQVVISVGPHRVLVSGPVPENVQREMTKTGFVKQEDSECWEWLTDMQLDELTARLQAVETALYVKMLLSSHGI